MPTDLLDLDAESLTRRAAARRDGAWGRVLTYSPKVFLPLTDLCRNVCDYCAFRKAPGVAVTMSPAAVERTLGAGQAAGCTEALFCLGDTPESMFPTYRRLLAAYGHGSTVDYLEAAGERALELGLFPHTNAGILSREDLSRLARVNVSMGLMLESVSERLCRRGGPHQRAPDKRPGVRLKMLREAGALGIPFTTGVLVGIGETWSEVVDTLVAIRDLHRDYGHIQEVIVQNFRAHADTRMAAHPEPSPADVRRAVSLARLILDDEVSVQAPPNLNPGETAGLIAAGINDFGGISPVTPDFINRSYPWPHLDRLGEACRASGFSLVPRLPVYDRFVDRLSPGLQARVRQAGARPGQASASARAAL